MGLFSQSDWPAPKGVGGISFFPWSGCFFLDFLTQNIPNVAALVIADMEGWLTPLVD